MAHKKFISAVMWTLLSINMLTLVFAGLMAWLGYAIPTRLKQLGFAPELVIGIGFGSLFVACLGLCGLNYSSVQLLYLYGFSCLIFVLLLVIGLPEFIYKSKQATGSGRNITTVADNNNRNGTIIHNTTAAAALPSFIVKDIMYFSLISLLLLLITISIIFAQHLKKKQQQQQQQQQASSIQQSSRFVNRFSFRNHNKNHNNNSLFVAPVPATNSAYRFSESTSSGIAAQDSNAGLVTRSSCKHRLSPSILEQLSSGFDANRNNLVISRSKSLAVPTTSTEGVHLSRLICTCQQQEQLQSRSQSQHNNYRTSLSIGSSNCCCHLHSQTQLTHPHANCHALVRPPNQQNLIPEANLYSRKASSQLSGVQSNADNDASLIASSSKSINCRSPNHQTSWSINVEDNFEIDEQNRDEDEDDADDVDGEGLAGLKYVGQFDRIQMHRPSAATINTNSFQSAHQQYRHHSTSTQSSANNIKYYQSNKSLNNNIIRNCPINYVEQAKINMNKSHSSHHLSNNYSEAMHGKQSSLTGSSSRRCIKCICYSPTNRTYNYATNSNSLRRPLIENNSLDATYPYRSTYAIGRIKTNRPSQEDIKIKNKKRHGGSSSVMAMTAAAAAAIFGGVVDTGHIDNENFDDDLHNFPTEMDEFQIGSAGDDCQCEMSNATNEHHHLQIPLLEIDNKHSVGWSETREPLLDFGPLMSHEDILHHENNMKNKQTQSNDNNK